MSHHSWLTSTSLCTEVLNIMYNHTSSILMYIWRYRNCMTPRISVLYICLFYSLRSENSIKHTALLFSTIFVPFNSHQIQSGNNLNCTSSISPFFRVKLSPSRKKCFYCIFYLAWLESFTLLFAKHNVS